MLSTDAVTKEPRLGATRRADGVWEFLLWAPNVHTATLCFPSGDRESLEMEALPRGYYRAEAKDLETGTQYLFELDPERKLPDPASRFQPQGVHGPSQIVDVGAFPWTDKDWTGRPLESSVIYELHVGTYTPEGSFEALIRYLPELVNLGVTTIELMPVAQFPGGRNWGYDGTYLFAPQSTYGGPQSLQRLVNAAHAVGLSIVLDVVYNHLGPEGNYLSAYGPYFTDRYRSPWGQAINFDGADCGGVRRFFIENALYWLRDYHIDGLRLDAVHAIFDFGARHFLAELKASVTALSERVGRKIYLIAESDLNDSRILHGETQGGYALDAQWSDDFHHSVHALLTGENVGYYSDFEGITPLAATLKDGWYYSGQYSRFRKRRHGNSPRGISPSHFVVCNQNHDQVGNRAAGERLNTLVNFEATKLAAGVTLLSPFIPMLFMGEEYSETAPFQYFTSHGDPALVEAVRRGRREEFAAFGWEESVPDPQAEETFSRSQLDHSLKAQEPHSTLFRFYQRLIRIREEQQLGTPASHSVHEPGGRALLVLRTSDRGELATLLNFTDRPVIVESPRLSGTWSTVICSADGRWNGPEMDLPPTITLLAAGKVQLSPQSFLVIERSKSTTEAE